MIRTKIAHRKSLSQKANRYKKQKRNRHFGLKDVNIPFLESRVLVNIGETLQDLVPEQPNIKPRTKKTFESENKNQSSKYTKKKSNLQN
jgi:disks large-associated protein 5